MTTSATISKDLFHKAPRGTAVFNALISVLALYASQVASAQELEGVCARRPTNVPAALTRLAEVWAQRGFFDRDWKISLPENSTRSQYEIYTRYAGFSLALGIPARRAISTLNAAGVAGRRIASRFDWEDYARMGEAALITRQPMEEAMTFMKRTYDGCRTRGWETIDFARVASAAFIARSTPEAACTALNQVYRHSNSGYWTTNSYSRVAEGALVAQKTVQEAAQTLDEVYRAARSIRSTGWNDDDYARVARAALVANVSGAVAMQALKDVYEVSRRVTTGWEYRDYSRIAAVAIITGKPIAEAVNALKQSYDDRRLSGSGWGYADYSTMAAAGLLGVGDGESVCMRFLKAW